MGRLTIKKKAIKRIKGSYNQEVNEMREWQDNQFNPGYYIGTGRVPYPLRKIGKRPRLKWLYLLYIFGPMLIALAFTGISWYHILALSAVAGVFALIIYDSKKHID